MTPKVPKATTPLPSAICHPTSRGGDAPILPEACTAEACTAGTPEEDQSESSEMPHTEGILLAVPPVAALPGPRKSVMPSSCRSGPPAAAEDAALEVLFDGNKKARGFLFMDVGTTEVSPNGRSVRGIGVARGV